MTDFAVPREPEITTPPIRGLTPHSSRAVLIASWPTTAASGKTDGPAAFRLVKAAPAADAASAADTSASIASSAALALSAASLVAAAQAGLPAREAAATVRAGAVAGWSAAAQAWSSTSMMQLGRQDLPHCEFITYVGILAKHFHVNAQPHFHCTYVLAY